MRLPKVRRITRFIPLFLISMMLFSTTLIVFAKEPDYVGVRKNQEFTWRYTYEEEGFKQYYNDLSSTLGLDFGNINTNTEGMRWIIKEIDDEEDSYNAQDGVKIEVERYFTEDFGKENAWERDKDFDSTIVYEFDDDYYTLGFLVLGNILIAMDINWEELAEEMTDLEDYAEIEQIESKVRMNGMVTTIEWDGMKDQRNIVKYSQNGVLEFGAIEYDGEIILQLELQQLISGYNLPIIIIPMFISLFGLITLIMCKLKNQF